MALIYILILISWNSYFRVWCHSAERYFSPAPTPENKHSIAIFDDSEWTVSIKNPRNWMYIVSTHWMCVFCVSMCVSSLFFFFFGQTVSPPLSHLNTLRRYRSCGGQAASFPFRLWRVITGSWLPVRLNQYFPIWGLIGLKETVSSWGGGGWRGRWGHNLNKSSQNFSVFYCHISKKTVCL